MAKRRELNSAKIWAAPAASLEVSYPPILQQHLRGMKTINRHLSRFDLGNTKTKHKAHHQNWGGQSKIHFWIVFWLFCLCLSHFFVWADVFCKIVTSDFRSFLGFYITKSEQKHPLPCPQYRSRFIPTGISLERSHDAH